jgi:hypothetical protein
MNKTGKEMPKVHVTKDDFTFNLATGRTLVLDLGEHVTQLPTIDQFSVGCSVWSLGQNIWAMSTTERMHSYALLTPRIIIAKESESGFGAGEEQSERQAQPSEVNMEMMCVELSASSAKQWLARMQTSNSTKSKSSLPSSCAALHVEDTNALLRTAQEDRSIVITQVPNCKVVSGQKVRFKWTQKDSSSVQLSSEPSDVEELLYTMLKKDGYLKLPSTNYVITAKTIQGRKLIDAQFTRKSPDGNGFDIVARAKEAELRVDLTGKQIMVHMRQCHIVDRNDATAYVESRIWPVELPNGLDGNPDKIRDKIRVHKVVNGWQGVLQPVVSSDKRSVQLSLTLTQSVKEEWQNAHEVSSRQISLTTTVATKSMLVCYLGETTHSAVSARRHLFVLLIPSIERNKESSPTL